MQVPLAALTEPLRATLVGSDATIERVITDSRLARPGDLFVPLVAERDGHDFIGAALAAGATAALSERSADNLGLDLAARLLLVAHTGAALNDLAGFARARMSGSVIGVTGSVGKTTVKDLMAGVLATKLVTSASERSFNNEIGVPLTLCNAPDDVEALVVEMGARGPGHIAALCELAHPRVGVVTVVAGAHLELFGDLAGVAVAKGELIEALPADGTAVLNADDPFVAAMAARSAAPVLTFGRAAGDVRAGDIALGDDLRASFLLTSPWGSASVRLAIAGEHHVTNALAAAAVALDAGISVESVAEALGAATISPWRMEVVTTPGGATLINDAYNANPTSMSAALTALGALPARRRVAVLGEMAELGADAEALHHEMVSQARSLGIEVVAVGTDAYGIAEVPPADAAAVLSSLGEGEAALVKGSRVAGLEQLVSWVVGG
ncbi:MAG: UDP-N-acetylmuramoyl-tripeptide--D-alanyl-D-alanine ligase [Candidatus Microthrix sp.]|nr:UDP-N-acetylmuramoyl-tripeptide--D-alanyl-D-alanine ligase [Candidatus Microthrix sp.]